MGNGNNEENLNDKQTELPISKQENIIQNNNEMLQKRKHNKKEESKEISKKNIKQDEEQIQKKKNNQKDRQNKESRQQNQKKTKEYQKEKLNEINDKKIKETSIPKSEVQVHERKRNERKKSNNNLGNDKVSNRSLNKESKILNKENINSGEKKNVSKSLNKDVINANEKKFTLSKDNEQKNKEENKIEKREKDSKKNINKVTKEFEMKKINESKKEEDQVKIERLEKKENESEKDNNNNNEKVTTNETEEEKNKKEEKSVPAPVTPPVVKSWADLFSSSTKSTVSKVKVNKAGKPISTKTIPKSNQNINEPVNINDKIKISFDYVPIQPRGLVNNGNMCFMNAILQPLLYCQPFYNFISSLQKETIHDMSNKPSLIESLIMFINEFKVVKKKDLEKEEYGEAFLPEYVYNTLRKFNSSNTLKGRQEDAEEYLGFLLNGIHDEYVSKYLKPKNSILGNNKSGNNSSSSLNGNNSEVWVEVGPRKKAVITREVVEVKESPITKIFGGRIRSILKCPGSKNSATIEPFLSLQLDITPSTVDTIEDALKNLTISEILPDYNNGGVIVNATKQNVLDKLPNVLLLHLKCFTFDNNTTQKVQKQIQFKMTLDITSDLLSSVAKVHQPYKYNLFAVVYHHGKMAIGGHYTCAVKQCNNKWLNFDDTKITPITEADVTFQKKNQLPYLLLYILDQPQQEKK